MTAKRIFAVQLLLIFPALLFMGALIVRQLSPLQYQPAYTASRDRNVVCGQSMDTLGVAHHSTLAVLVTGCVTLLQSWDDFPRLPDRIRQGLHVVHADGMMLVTTLITLTAGIVLAIVALHMAAH